MDSLDIDILVAEASIHKAAFGDGNAPWDVFKRSIDWFKLRKTMNYIERQYFAEAWSAV